ncbi:hypothetical protein D3C81_1890470 [compost metagenome]
MLCGNLSQCTFKARRKISHIFGIDRGFERGIVIGAEIEREVVARMAEFIRQIVNSASFGVAPRDIFQIVNLLHLHVAATQNLVGGFIGPAQGAAITGDKLYFCQPQS